MAVNLCNARMPSDESQLTNGPEFEGFRALPAEDSYDIACHQGALACRVLCGRGIRTFRFRFGILQRSHRVPRHLHDQAPHNIRLQRCRRAFRVYS